MEEENNAERCCRVDAATPVIAPSRSLFFPATLTSPHCSLFCTFSSSSTSVASFGCEVSLHATTTAASEGQSWPSRTRWALNSLGFHCCAVLSTGGSTDVPLPVSFTCQSGLVALSNSSSSASESRKDHKLACNRDVSSAPLNGGRCLDVLKSHT